MPRSLLGAWARAWEWTAGHASVQTVPLALPRPDFVERYDAVYASLAPEDLHDEEEVFDDAALAEELFREDGRAHRFLGFYSETGGRQALERYGFFDRLRARGFDPILVGDMSDPDQHRLRVYDGIEARDRVLIELVVGVRLVEFPDHQSCRFLFVNWLMMQDPRAEFGPAHRQLPDQEHPGLGLFIHFAYLLKLISDRIGCDGLMNHPSHVHNGVLYGKVCHFVDPVIEGRFRALERDLDPDDLIQLTHWIDAGQVVDQHERPFQWRPAPQVLPVSRRARRFFCSTAYRQQMKQTRDDVRFHLVGQRRPSSP